ncbi:MAG TPA: type II toxin-antitoxin system PemK/MazF family toxin [Aggregatilineaceae bacterium]|jgi:mRNA interferase MazF|nr:type II toxin-antitoxin system PemK/MazF family toxin [Aggregatilineaceae bacterium]
MAPGAPAGWFPHRGEICVVRLDKGRPALIVSSDTINRHALDVCVVPITSVEHRRFALRVMLGAGEGGLARPSWAKCDQVTTIEKRLVRYPPLGRVSDTALSRVEAGIKAALQLP